KDQAARRYNSDVQKINVIGFERFQGSYELKGYTARKEGFVCSFDADSQFLHLSMR
ncbi:YsaB family lipoprotein, partial [Klebsiella pneumoniae]|uniref:YsaB family lipoprotein n=1 Tax=Klebsiella pneumoniae TaxID=573 RepID=UPI001F087887